MACCLLDTMSVYEPKPTNYELESRNKTQLCLRLKIKSQMFASEKMHAKCYLQYVERCRSVLMCGRRGNYLTGQRNIHENMITACVILTVVVKSVLANSVAFRQRTVQYMTVLHTALQWEACNILRIHKNTRNTIASWVSQRATCAVCCMTISFKIDFYKHLSDGPLARYAILRVRMRRECRERFPRHCKQAIPTCITARASRTCRDACRDR